MRMVAPRTGAEEISIAENQTDYLTLTAAKYELPNGTKCLLTRWRLTEEERQQVMAGEDLYLLHLTFDQPLQPVNLQVGSEGYIVS